MALVTLVDSHGRTLTCTESDYAWAKDIVAKLGLQRIADNLADTERRKRHTGRLTLSATATRPREETEFSELLDRLARGIGQLKTLADRSLTALRQDIERRRVAHFTQQYNARRARHG